MTVDMLMWTKKSQGGLHPAQGIVGKERMLRAEEIIFPKKNTTIDFLNTKWSALEKNKLIRIM